MRFQEIPESEFKRRIESLKQEMVKSGVECFIGYSSECESASVRYLTGFWPFFDFSAVVIPAEGEAVLVTGGPESYEFARSFSKVKNIRIDPSLVETSAPEWVVGVEGEGLDSIVMEACGRAPRVIALGNWNIFPKQLYDELMKLYPVPKIIRGDRLLLNVQAIKSEVELPYIKQAYRITEEAMKAAIEQAGPEKREWELEATARIKMLELGAEGMSYPAWVCSGPRTRLSLARSTDRVVGRNELIQYTFGAKFIGYCGNMCRPFSIGKMPEPAKKLAKVALEAVHYALDSIRPDVEASEIFKGYYNLLSRYGYEEYTLYGPAHGTGSSEVENLWLSKNADFLVKPNMVFNIDIWLSDGRYGLRYEDGILVTEDGIEELTSYRREVIEL